MNRRTFLAAPLILAPALAPTFAHALAVPATTGPLWMSFVCETADGVAIFGNFYREPFRFSGLWAAGKLESFRDITIAEALRINPAFAEAFPRSLAMWARP